jgi:hypothetical protein
MDMNGYETGIGIGVWELDDNMGPVGREKGLELGVILEVSWGLFDDATFSRLFFLRLFCAIFSCLRDLDSFFLRSRSCWLIQ